MSPPLGISTTVFVRAPQSKQCVEPSWNVVFLLGIYSAPINGAR